MYMGLPFAFPSSIMVSIVVVIISVVIAIDSIVVVVVVVVIVIVSPPTVNVIFLLHFQHVLSARSQKNILKTIINTLRWYGIFRFKYLRKFIVITKLLPFRFDSLRLIHVDILTILRKVNLFKQQMISARVLKVLKFLQNINYAMRRDCAKKKIKANFIVNWRWLMCLRYNINRTNLFVMKCANAERCVKKESTSKLTCLQKLEA